LELDGTKAKSARDTHEKNKLISDLGFQLNTIRKTMKELYSSSARDTNVKISPRQKQSAGEGSARTKKKDIISEAHRSVLHAQKMAERVRELVPPSDSKAVKIGSATDVKKMKTRNPLEERVGTLMVELEQQREMTLKAKTRYSDVSARAKYEREKLASEFQSKIELLEANLKKKELIVDKTKRKSREQITEMEAAFQRRIQNLERDVQEQQRLYAKGKSEYKKANTELKGKVEALGSELERHMNVSEANEQDWTMKVRMRDLEIDFLRREMVKLQDATAKQEEAFYQADGFEDVGVCEEEAKSDPVQQGLFSLSDEEYSSREKCMPADYSASGRLLKPTRKLNSSSAVPFPEEEDDEGNYVRTLSRRLIARPDLSSALLEHSRARRSATMSSHNRDYSNLLRETPRDEPQQQEQPSALSGLAQGPPNREISSPRVASSMRKDRWRALLASSTSLIPQHPAGSDQNQK